MFFLIHTFFRTFAPYSTILIMKTSKRWLAIVLAVMAGYAWAQGPNGSGIYYKDANGKKGEALKTALFHIINPHTSVGYDGLYDVYKDSDTRPDGYVRDWYSNVTSYRHVTDKAGSYQKEGDCYNREHTVPQSWFDSHGSASIIKCDAFHVVPADGKINGMRSNNPFGEVSSINGQSKNGYSKWGPNKLSGYSGVIFEPNDEIKGDIARIYFYMATCYESLATKWGNSVFTGTTYNPFSTWTYDMLVRWAKQDPVDDVEKARNVAVCGHQKNRNPFVDYPGLEDYVWGDKKNVAFSYDNYEGSGSGGDVVAVAMPVFSPEEGTYTDEVTVTLTSATADADIYYTTGGADASASSIPYEEPFTLTETTTVKAVAVKDGVSSSQAIATYTIKAGGSATPVDCTVPLNKVFFGYVAGNSTIAKGNSADLTGSENGITVNYALGSGEQRYASESQIRIYAGNSLTISASKGQITQLEFTSAGNDGSKTLQASTGTVNMNTLTWTGKAQSVTFTVDGGSGHIKLTAVKVTMAETDGISGLMRDEQQNRPVIYNLQGQQVAHPTHGLYIVNGKKVYIK